ncbi:hypothetical protein LEP1GSC098_0913 [Leptospira interrogans serovar Grippotyphosa str. UI 08434]|nr:hypothetical protein LEP1GSC098_0913 [Leptospira interrogans serovar Grippotyphosa str. UI 08434]
MKVKTPFTTRTHENSTKNQPHKLNRILESKAQKGTFFKYSDKNESFYLQKVCFSDRGKFSELYRLTKNRETQHNAFYESRWKTQHNTLYESRWKTQHNTLYESRWKTQHNALYESRWKTQHNALYESRWKTQHNALYESRWKTQHNALYESRCGVGYGY